MVCHALLHVCCACAAVLLCQGMTAVLGTLFCYALKCAVHALLHSTRSLGALLYYSLQDAVPGRRRPASSLGAWPGTLPPLLKLCPIAMAATLLLRSTWANTLSSPLIWSVHGQGECCPRPLHDPAGHTGVGESPRRHVDVCATALEVTPLPCTRTGPLTPSVIWPQ